MLNSLNARILFLLAGVLIVTAIAVSVTVWISTYRYALLQVDENLNVGTKVFSQILDNRNEQLINSAEVLTADFGFRQAVATGDLETIKSALDNQGSRINADLMALMSLDGKLQTYTGRLSPPTEFGHLAAQAQAEGAVAVNLVVDGKAIQAVLLPVNAPIPIAITLIGFELDNNLAARLNQIANLDVSFVVESVDQQTSIVSTLGIISKNILEASLDEDGLRLPFSKNDFLRSQSLNLVENRTGVVTAYLTDNMNDVLSEFNLLQLEITFIVLLAIGIAMLAGSVFARQLTQPLNRLVVIAKAIAQGDYLRSIDIDKSSREMSDLTEAFTKMQLGISEREAHISYQSTHDAITGLINREAYIDAINERIRNKEKFTLVSIGLTNFRQINDVLGPAMADLCLQSVSQQLLSSVDVAARLGGGSFACIFEEAVADEEIYDLCDRIKSVSDVDGLPVSFQLHSGVVSSGDVERGEDLLRRLYIATDSARHDQYEVFRYQDGQEEDYINRLEVIDELRMAINEGGKGLQMYYQPKLDLRTNKVTKMEALIRWIHPVRDFIPPDYFIPLAEQAGLITSITDWVIETVVSQIASLHKDGLSVQVAINLSAQDVTRPDLLILIHEICDRHGLPVSALSFEITESEIMHQPEAAIALLNDFRQARLLLAIDDFGTGYSSLSQLKHMPVTELKIDREFVMRLSENKEDQTIVQSTIQLAHSFNLEVTAEGVEDEGSLEFLRSCGCEWIQGYFIARPMAFDDIGAWVRDYNGD